MASAGGRNKVDGGERSSSEAGVADPAPTHERNDLLTLGDSIGREIEGGIGMIRIGGLNRGRGLVGIGEHSDELVDAVVGGGGFLNCVGFHIVGGGVGERGELGHELHRHIYRPIKHLGPKKKKKI